MVATCRGCGRSEELPADGWEYECLHCDGVLRLPAPARRAPRVRPFLFAGLALAAAIPLAFVLIQPAPDDLVLWPTLLYVLASPFVALVLVVWAKARRAAWSRAILIGATALIPVIPLPVALRLGWWARERDLAELARRSVPVIEAVRAFERDTGAPPSTLDALVPDYLSALPKTGDWYLDDFGYWAVDGAFGFRIQCSANLLNWDAFYWPPDWPPEELPPGDVSMIEGWAYYHE